MDKKLYKLARQLNKTATTIRDVKTIATGDPQKIAKRAIRKQTYRTTHRQANTISKMVERLLK